MLASFYGQFSISAWRRDAKAPPEKLINYIIYCFPNSLRRLIYNIIGLKTTYAINTDHICCLKQCQKRNEA